MKYTFSLFLITLSLFAVPAVAQLQLMSTIAGDGTAGYAGDGDVATAAQLWGPLGVAVDGNYNVYVEDYYNLRIRKVNTSGEISTFAGNGSIGKTGDGLPATSAPMSPNGVAVDRKGNVYISDAVYSVVRKVNTLGIISTVAGNGTPGYYGDNGAATSAELDAPAGLAVDTFGNLYIADLGNNVIRMVNTSGIITTIAGTGAAGYFGDGGLAVYALLDSPYAIAVDQYQNIYISDNKNNVIRKIDTTSTIYTYAGTAVAGYSGDNGSAQYAAINNPRGIAVDTLGDLFIADANNNVVRKVDTGAIITTAVGNGSAGFGGDLGTVNGAVMHSPYGVAVDKQGSIYIADANNERIRKAYNPTLAVHNITLTPPISLYPNPFRDNITVSGLTVSDKVAVYDITGRQVTQTWNISNAGSQSFNIGNIPGGIYMLQVFDGNGAKKATIKLVKE